MRLSLAALSFAALATSVLAQNLPACANPCILNSTNYDGCQGTDNNCLCHSQVFVSRTTECIMADCSGDDLQSAIDFAQQLCLKVGVTLATTATTPGPTSTGSSNATSTSGGSTTGTGTGTGAPTQTSPSGALANSAHMAAAGLAVIAGVVSLVL